MSRTAIRKALILVRSQTMVLNVNSVRHVLGDDKEASEAEFDELI
jgi:hypothetical protein